MPIIMFLIDNSASMNQRTFYGTSLLDVARGAVEQFTKMRERDIHSRWDRRMLLTMEESPHHIKAGWKESVATFNAELRNMKANGMTTMGTALGRSFDLLNLNRAQTGLDCFGQGRYPTSNESAIIICITDGQKLTSDDGSASDIIIPGPQVPLSDLYLEPFRWDQRLYSLVLRIPATEERNREANGNQFVEKASDSPINAMCEVTGGRSYKIENLRQLNQCLESICQKCQPGAVLNFQIDPDVKEIAWQNSLKMIYLKQHNQRGFNHEHWPLPEPYMPTSNAYSLPARQAHPVVRFRSCRTGPQVPDRFPFDKFELEASPLTQFILETRDNNCAWECSIPGSAYGNGDGQTPPFGFLKPSSNLQNVNLFVLPYNYPQLFRLIDEFHRTRHNLAEDFHERFKQYMDNVPAYYYHRLTFVLEQQGFPRQFMNSYREIVNNNGSLSLNVRSLLSRAKTSAKTEFDNLIREVSSKGPNEDKIRIKLNSIRQSSCDPPSNEALEMRTFSCSGSAPRWIDQHPRPYENPYDIHRTDIRKYLSKMRNNLQELVFNRGRPMDSEWAHHQSMMQMGNFQEHINKIQHLRPLEEGPQRQHSFGNPFKVRNSIVIDEADADVLGGASPPGGSSSGNRRQRSMSTSSDTSSLSNMSNLSRPSLPLLPDYSYRTWRTLSRPSSPAVHRNLNSEDRSSDIARFTSELSNGLESLNTGSLPFESGLLSPDGRHLCKQNGQTTLNKIIVSDLKRYDALVQMIRSPIFDGKSFHHKLCELECETSLQSDIINYLTAEAQRFQRHSLIPLLHRRYLSTNPPSSHPSPPHCPDENEPLIIVNSREVMNEEENQLNNDCMSLSLPRRNDNFDTHRQKLKARANGTNESQNGVYPGPPMKMLRLDISATTSAVS